MELSKKQLDDIVEGLHKTLDEPMQKMAETVLEKTNEVKTELSGRIDKVENIAKSLRASRHIFGNDASGLSGEEKKEFVAKFVEAAKGKAFSAEDPSKGGILIPTEVYNGIFRVAQTVGLVAKFATRFPMNGTSEMIVPKYTGRTLEGAYVGDDDGGSETDATLGNANLRTRTWQVLMRIPEKLIRNAGVDVADWIIALIAEGLSYKLDKVGFVGTTPFVGVLNHASVPVVTGATGADTYAEFTYDKASEGIANIEESQLDGSAFFFHRTVLHALRIQKDSANNYLLTNANPVLVSELGSGLRPQGRILNFPVYTSPVLPATSVGSQASTIFGCFGNLKNVFFGDGGSMDVALGTANSSFEKRQIAYRINHEHSIVVGLPDAKGLVNFKTSAS